MSAFTLADAVNIRDALMVDREILNWFAIADSNALKIGHSKHGEQHGRDVMHLGGDLMGRIEQIFPGYFSAWEMQVYGPIAFYLHDIGRVYGEKGHDKIGAALVGRKLKNLGMPQEHRREICWAIRNHRSDRSLALEFDSKIWALLVLADGCVGDSDRVAGWEATKIHLARFLYSRDQLWDRADQHNKNNLANFSIQKASIVIDPGDSPEPRYRGAIVLRLNMNDRMGTFMHVLTVDWFRNKYHSCARAAQHLGLVFRVESNGTRYFWSKQQGGWCALGNIHVPRS